MNYWSIFILIPLAILILLNIFTGDSEEKSAFWVVVVLTLLQAVYTAILPVEFWNQTLGGLGNFLPINFHPDNISRVLLVAIGITAFGAVVTGRYTLSENKRFNFFNLILVSLIGMNGVVLAGDIFTMYVFMEVISVSSFILIAIEKEKNAFEGAFKYVIMSAIATALMLASIGIIFLAVGNTSFAAISDYMKISGGQNHMVIIAVCLFVAGLFIKGGLVPFHGWLPDAYQSAPAAVSVLLAGIVTKTTGIYTLIRLVVTVFGFSSYLNGILLFVGVVSIVVGALGALGQKDFKRMLAYSSISQVGYIVAGLGCGTYLGIFGAVFHLFNHSVFKSILFMNSAAVEKQTGTREMDKLGGLASKMPVTGGTSATAFLSTAGIPPLAGFWSKLIIIMALWQSGNYTYAVISILAGVITLAYFLLMQKEVFFGKLKAGLEHIKEAEAGFLVPVVLLSVITIVIGLVFPFWWKW